MRSICSIYEVMSVYAIDNMRTLQKEVTEWRRHLHQHPEIGYRLESTSQFVSEKLASFGINHIETGIAETGVVAIIQGESGGPTIGLRADMDALPINETSGKPWASLVAGKMHGCGHDGHTAMLLGAAKHLAGRPNFKGSVALIFQPAEEAGQGGQKMVQEGIMERFGISQVFGLHCDPGMEIGKFGIRHGQMLGGLSEFDLIVKGKGGHAAEPQKCVDPVILASQIALGLQTIVSRATDPLESLVVSITSFHAGEGYNSIPEKVALCGTVRTLSNKLMDDAEIKIHDYAKAIAEGFGGSIEFQYHRLEPPTINHPSETDLAIQVARALVGQAAVNDKYPVQMGSEDFSYMLQVRPGCYMMLGSPTAEWHHPAFDFNDDAIPYGMAYWVTLVETLLAV